MSGLAQNFERAVALHQQGRLDEAEPIYRSILQSKPREAPVRQLLGLVAYQRGNLKEAAELIETAILASPDQADFHNNLGEIYRGLNRMADAAKCYERALRLNSSYAHAHNNLGLARKALGDRTVARLCFQAALRVDPGFAEAWTNLGVLQQQDGELTEALACFEHAAVAKPGFALAHWLLGEALKQLGRKNDAAAALREAIRLNPNLAEARYALGELLVEDEQLVAAEEHLESALVLRPNYPEAHNILGLCARARGQFGRALVHFDHAIRLKSGFVAAYNNRGLVYRAIGKPGSALADYRQALELEPTNGPALGNLGNMLLEVGQLDEASEVLERVVALSHPQEVEFAEHLLNLGNVRKEQGSLDQAITCFRRATELQPARPMLGDNLLLALHYHADCSADDLAVAHRKWGAGVAQQYRPSLPHVPRALRKQKERIRVGYVSPDFRQHAVARFMLPLLENHDHRVFEIFGYADVLVPDSMTARLQALTDTWRNIAVLHDAAVADLVRRDEIDILVDLAAHTARNRLLVFARKPAPIQVTYLAYCSTTGLDTLDYRISDFFLDPEGTDFRHYTERTIRLPGCYWCYSPPEIPLDVGVLPALAAKKVTFGCLNNFCKVTDATLRLWCRVLRVVPDSRLLLYSLPGRHRERVFAAFRAAGLEASRLEFVGYQPFDRYLATYQEIDIALDPFPFAGGTTTCDALWMGVPVVSMTGQTAVSRGGLSLLSNVGLADLVARNDQDYVQIAAGLAQDETRLAELRGELRMRLQKSPLMDARNFAARFEDALGMMCREVAGGKVV